MKRPYFIIIFFLFLFGIPLIIKPQTILSQGPSDNIICDSLLKGACNQAQNCFWYKGGRTDSARCVSNDKNKGNPCGTDNFCYADQQCHLLVNKGYSPFAVTGFCGNGDLKENEACDTNEECLSSFCNGKVCKTNDCTNSGGLQYSCYDTIKRNGCPDGWTDSRVKSCGFSDSQVCCYNTKSGITEQVDPKSCTGKSKNECKNTAGCTYDNTSGDCYNPSAPPSSPFCNSTSPNSPVTLFKCVDKNIVQTGVLGSNPVTLKTCTATQTCTSIGTSCVNCVENAPEPGPPPSSSCSSIKVTNPDGSPDPVGTGKCTQDPKCFINTQTYGKSAVCSDKSTLGTVCGKDSNGNPTYCNTKQSCQTLSGIAFCTDNGTVQPGNGGNSCKTADGKLNNAVCSSGKCNPTSYTCEAVKPIPSDPKTETAPCKNHGDIKTYINSTCGGELYNITNASGGNFCGQHYADRYICNDGTTEDWAISAQDPVCSSGAWCPAGSKESGITTGCKDNAGKDLDCATKGPGWVCTNDYPLDLSGTKNMSCTPPGTRYCGISMANVYPAQGCGSPYRIENQDCIILPGNKDNCDPARNLTCKTIGGRNVCAPNGILVVTTPGAPDTSSCDSTRFGHFPEGCPCPDGGGCGGPLLGCYKAADTADNYCSPAAPRADWCVRKGISVTDNNSCKSGIGLTPSPTPPDLLWQSDCPWDAALGNICLPTCGSNHQPNTKLGPGGTTGDKACSYSTPGSPGYNNTSNPTGAVCCVPKTATPVSGGGTTQPQPPTSHTPTAAKCWTASNPTDICYNTSGNVGTWVWQDDAGDAASNCSGMYSHFYKCQ
jgi:hypothetical protein